MYALNRTDQKFGDLKVIGMSNPQGNMIFWPCQCWCGNYRSVEEKRLVSGQITMYVPCVVRKKMERTFNNA